MLYYYFILGKNKNLSIAEIFSCSFLQDIWEKEESLYSGENFLLFPARQEMDAAAVLARLGGTIKIGKIISFSPDSLLMDLKKELASQEGKICFGFSQAGKLNFSLPKLAISLKKELRAQGKNGRWVKPTSGKELSSVVVAKNKLLQKGGEFYFFSSQGKFFWGKTLAVQDFSFYSRRDFGRPCRDMRSGMLPPKLAKIMINLSQADPAEPFLDPFCGGGTVLQEAILLGFKKLFVLDIAEAALAATEKNIAWLKENFSLPEFSLVKKQGSAEHLDLFFSPNYFAAIVTEPYLGPTQKKISLPFWQKKLTKLYAQFFSAAARVLKPQGKLVFISPAFFQGEQLIFLDIIPIIKKNFRLAPWLAELEKKKIVSLTPRQSFLYSQPTPRRRLAREIFVLEKK